MSGVAAGAEPANPKQSAEFRDLEQIAKRWLHDDFASERIELALLMAIVQVLNQAANADELAILLDFFSRSYPTLAGLFEHKAGEAKHEVEQSLQDIVNKMLQDDPLQAAAVAKAVMEPNMNLAKLRERFPEVDRYLDNNA